MVMIKDSNVQAGIAEVLLGQVNTAYSETDFRQSVGLLKSVVEVTPTRRPLEMLAGIPQGLQKSVTIEEGISVKMTFAESRLPILYRALGGGTLSTNLTGSMSVVDEAKILEGTAYHLLRGWNIAASPLPVVTDGGATPVTYTVDVDYELDRTSGKIRRISTGSIADGGVVYCTYTWTKPNFQRLLVGGSTARLYLPIQVHFPRDDGHREVLTVYKAYPAGEVTRPYNETDWNLVQAEFRGAYDSSRATGDQLFRWETPNV